MTHPDREVLVFAAAGPGLLRVAARDDGSLPYRVERPVRMSWDFDTRPSYMEVRDFRLTWLIGRQGDPEVDAWQGWAQTRDDGLRRGLWCLPVYVEGPRRRMELV